MILSNDSSEHSLIRISKMGMSFLHSHASHCSRNLLKCFTQRTSFGRGENEEREKVRMIENRNNGKEG
jgi:hypothetical protein